MAQDTAAKAIFKKYAKLSAPLANRVIGTVTADIPAARDTPSGQTAAGEQPMGDVIADAMLGDLGDRLRRRRGGVHERGRRPRRACCPARSWR